MVPEKVNVRTAKDGTMVATVDFGELTVEKYRTDRFGRGLWWLRAANGSGSCRSIASMHKPRQIFVAFFTGMLTLCEHTRAAGPPWDKSGRPSLLTQRASDLYAPNTLRNCA